MSSPARPPKPGAAPGARKDARPGPVVQRKEELSGAAPPLPMAIATGGTGTGRALVEDGAEPGPGQMTRSGFLARVRETVVATANAELAAVGRSAADCPYLGMWLAYYEGRPAAQVERAVRGYARPEGDDAAGLLVALEQRVREGVRTWVASGRVPDLAGAGGPGGDAAGRVQAFHASGAAPGAGTGTPGAVRGELGPGRPLEPAVRGRMEKAFGESFHDVRVHTGPRAADVSRRISARAFAVGTNVGFGRGEYRPGTLPGDLLLAHELAHVVQQRGGVAERDAPPAADPLERQADRAAAHAAASLWQGADRSSLGPLSLARGAGLSLSSCRSEPKGPTPVRVPFSVVRAEVARATDAASREAAVQTGVDSARGWLADLKAATSTGKGPVPAIRTRIMAETSVTLDENPYFGITADRVEQAYRAWAGGAALDPWLLLALWVKEGRSEPVRNSVSAGSAADARSIWRSIYYYQNMGLDHFTHVTTTSGDNTIDTSPAGAAAHETDFKAAVAAQAAAGRLPRDISAEINAEISATARAGSPGVYDVTATSKFYSLSLLLADAYYRQNAEALAADPRIGANPDPGLVYARWNMGATRFERLVRSAEGHRMEPAYDMPGGKHPSIAEWSFHRTVKKGEYDVPRSNAVRFLYYLEAYKYIYEGGF